MRLNKFIAENTALSRRGADSAIEQGKITINGQKAALGAIINESDQIKLEGIEIRPKQDHKLVVLLNKPVGYVCSKDGQGSPTVYELLPTKFKDLNIAGRLDKDSCGLVLLTNDGNLLNELTHPSNNKDKIYFIELDKPLSAEDINQVEQGVELEDGPSKLILENQNNNPKSWQITMQEGRNRQIRRTFAALGNHVNYLNRIQIGKYSLNQIIGGNYSVIVI